MSKLTIRAIRYRRTVRQRSLLINSKYIFVFQDPEHQDFNGIVDFSNAVPGPDGSWCITKVGYLFWVAGLSLDLTASYWRPYLLLLCQATVGRDALTKLE